MVLGVYGKHPAKGDFLQYGLPPAVLKPLETWLDAALAEARSTLGPAWEAVWPAAPHLHFWLGEAVWGTPVSGVMAASRDRVGRRFPLVLLACGGDVPPPPAVSGAAQDWHAALSVHLAACLARPVLDQPAELVSDAPWPDTGEGTVAPVPAEFWALRPGATVGVLWDEVALADHRRAAAGRSYWWTEGAEAQVVTAEPAEAPPTEDIPPDDPAPVPEAETVTPPPEEDAWTLPEADIADDEGSPFDAAPGGLGLFAAPEPAPAFSAPEAVAEVAPPAPTEIPPRPAQIWAGAGLPSGAVLAWFFRGHVGNG